LEASGCNFRAGERSFSVNLACAEPRCMTELKSRTTRTPDVPLGRGQFRLVAA
jgi:hypothetical protein